MTAGIKNDNDIHQRQINKNLIMHSSVNSCSDGLYAEVFGIIDLKCDYKFKGHESI